MTEPPEDGDFLVRVRAQVMTRDDSSGGWVPMGGGGLSNVSVRKRPIIKPPPPQSGVAPALPAATTDSSDLALALALQYEYLIFGQRISDSSTVLSCIIKRDFEYNKVMPTFHHWKTGERRFGLTFQAAADARAFDKGVRTAVEELLEVAASLVARPWGNACPLASAPARHLRLLQRRQFQYKYCAADLLEPITYLQPNEGLAGTSSPLQFQTADDDDDVFMTLNLPVERGDSRSSSDSSGRGGGNSRHPTPPSEPQFSHPHQHLHRISYLPRHPNNGSSNGSSDNEKGGCTHPWSKSAPYVSEGKIVSPDKEHLEGVVPIDTDNYSYVQLTAVHEYTYPMMDDQKGGHSMRRESCDSLKKLGGGGMHEPGTPQQPPLPVKASGRNKGSCAGGGSSRRARCKYCQEVFTVDLNRRGACDFAPDKMRNLMETVSCMQAAQGMTYHCMSDSEGDFVQRPCQCGAPLDNGCARRWLGLGILSLLVPCLCLYPPLRACHWCCVSCGACGGRHMPADQ